MRVLLIDNHDSFTWNLAHDIASLTGELPLVWPHERPVPDVQAWFDGFDAIVVSPGPGTPERATDLGLSRAALDQAVVPVLGVCLGMQAMGVLAGIDVVRAPRPVHGEVELVRHRGTGLFAGLPDPLPMVRYHSLALDLAPEAHHPDLVVDAWADGLVMGVHHATKPQWGVQTHPESICSDHGRDLMRTFLDLARQHNGSRRVRGDMAVSDGAVGMAVADGAAGVAVADGAVGMAVADGAAGVAVADGAVGMAVAEGAVGVCSADGAVSAVAGSDGAVSAAGGVRSAGAEVVAQVVLVRRFETPLDAESIVAGVLGRSGGGIGATGVAGAGADHVWWLDSATGGVSACGSAAGPSARVAVADGGRTRVTDASGATRHHDMDLLDLVRADLGTLEVRDLDTGQLVDRPPFVPGWVGHLGYEYACAQLPGGVPAGESELGTPAATLVFSDRVVCVADGVCWVMALTTPEVDAAQRTWIERTARRIGGLTPLAPTEPADVPVREVRIAADGAAYRELIASCQEQIAAGESYELCLTTRIDVAVDDVAVDDAAGSDAAGRDGAAAPGAFDVWQLYRTLRARAPRPFGAYLDFGDVQVLSASPERFVSVTDGLVEAKPIKGTRPRGATAAEDAALAEELRCDVKERAENLMIVDLLRNDLSRVCEPGSVHVPLLFDVETHAGVHQLVSTIRGELTPGRDVVDVLRAALPPGSMTGAPKERSVDILRDLEGGDRGVYSGVIGYIGVDGRADWSVVIRTIVHRAGVLGYGVGGAVTARSTPDGEWNEILVKARTLGDAVGVDLATLGATDGAVTGVDVGARARSSHGVPTGGKAGA